MGQLTSGISFHLAPIAYFETFPLNLDYIPEPMAAGKESFIHCTNGLENLVDVGNRYYRDDAKPYLFLVIDLAKVRDPIKFEDPARIYPHIYGSLNRDAIIDVVPITRDTDGAFLPVVDQAVRFPQFSQ